MDPLNLDGYYTVQQIWDFSNDWKSGQFLSVIGFVKDFQHPIKTRGTSWKCTLEIFDLSTFDKGLGLQVVIFWPETSMPLTPNIADVIIISKARALVNGGYPSLLANISTTIHILPANDVPQEAFLTANIQNLWFSCSYDYGPNSKKVPGPSMKETQYAILMNKRKDEVSSLASSLKLNLQRSLTKNTREKFELIKDVQPNSFYNIIGEVRKSWESSDVWVNVYLSDYTSNSQLLNYTREEDPLHLSDQVKNVFGHIDTLQHKNTSPGPYGKLIIQVTLWDSDAEFFRNQVQCGQWLYIKNVRMKLGRNNILEGSVNGQDGKIHIQKLETNCLSDINTRWKSALQRKQVWWKNYEQSLVNERINQSAEISFNKRKHELDNETPSPKRKNCKQRRKEEKVQADKKVARIDAEIAARLELNENSKRTPFNQIHSSNNELSKVQAGYPDQKILPLHCILLPTRFSHPGSAIIYAPFTNCRYRVNARVIDYFPDEIENFSVISHKSEISTSLISIESEDNEVRVEEWEWSFSLLLEEVSATKILHKERVWVFVNNHAAQALLNIEEDATDLRENQDLLVKVKEQLFKLWGDLEERKSDLMKKNIIDRNDLVPPSTDSETIVSSFNTNIGTQPDLDSDKEIEKSTRWISKKKSSSAIDNKNNNASIIDAATACIDLKPSNKAFTCCIQQYGVKVPEDNPTKANAGPRRRWQRLFGLFGTKIL